MTMAGHSRFAFALVTVLVRGAVGLCSALRPGAATRSIPEPRPSHSDGLPDPGFPNRERRNSGEADRAHTGERCANLFIGVEQSTEEETNASRKRCEARAYIERFSS